MNQPSLTVSSPLSVRLLRRLLLACALLILIAAGVRALWEYRKTQSTYEEVMLALEQAMRGPLAGSLEEFDVKHIAAMLEGIRSNPAISYAAVLENDRVLVESGERKSADALERRTRLLSLHDGQAQVLGELLLQTDLAGARGQALDAALKSMLLNTGLSALVGFILFLLTRSMISRHLADAAEHFRQLDLSGEDLRLPELRLRKKWAGDELDILCLAVNAMQENLVRTYAKVRQAEREASSQARFPQENPNPVLRAQADGVLISANKASGGFLAHADCTLGQRLPQPYAAPLREALATGRVQRFEAEYDGLTYAFAAVPVRPEGYVNLYGMDITERKLATDAIKRSLAEKEILLKEIHHRVKNNMQVISSLLFLQMEQVTDPADRELFAESQKRIQAMALVHEELYSSSDLSSVDMRDYVTRLVDRVLAGADVPVDARFALDSLRLPVTRSIPCGLALNELVMNAVKHAFRPRQGVDEQAVLRVDLRAEDGWAVLTVEDSGPGLPPDFDYKTSPTLGMTLVASLVRQLRGEMTSGNGQGGGACFRLRFPLDDAPA